MRSLTFTITALALCAQVAAAKPTVLTKGIRTVTMDPGTSSASDKTHAIQVVRSDGSSLELARTATEVAKVHASISKFLAQPKLIDVIVQESWEQGWHGGTRETHYVIDTSQAPDRVACTFVGNESSGGEYSSSSTTIALKKTGASPLSFDLVRTTASRSTHQINASKWDESKATAVEHLILDAASCVAPPASGQP